MDEKEIARQRDRYWLLSFFLMIIVVILLLVIGGKRINDPHRAVWKNFSLGDTARIVATKSDTGKNVQQNIH
jgi:hypothetical protein